MKTIRKALPFTIPIVGFIIIFIGINMFQYYRVKQTIKSGIIQTTGESELAEIQSFFSEVTSKLNIVRDWGKNGLLNTGDSIDLNKKFMPLVDHQEHISGVILANDQGEEYFLINQSPHLTTRTTKLLKGKAEMDFTEWASPEKALRKWHETATYDPRNRPWFRQNPSESDIFLSDIYTFHHTQKKGFTASVAWTNKQGKAQQHVFAIDILLDEIELLLKSINKKKSSLLFLANAKNNYFITEKTEETDHKDPDHLAGVTTVLSEVIESWKQEGTPVSTPLELRIKNKQWITSFQPLFPEQAFLWIGVISNDEALLGSLEKSLFTIDIFDIGIAFSAALLLFFIIWKTGLFKFEEPAPLTAEDRFCQYRAQGEGATVEFKSTIRTNLQTSKQGKEIEFAWLKALTAFLNSQGGALLLGVNDSGELLGLEADIFENDDKILLHTKNLINHHIGAEFSSYIAFSLLNMAQGKAMMIEVLPATNPVFLKIGKNEEFYIRSGPSTTKLTPSQMVSFVLQHQEKKQGK